MTATASTAVRTTPTRVRSLVTTGLVASLVAAAASTVVAVAGHAAGISLDVDGKPIPMEGFAELTIFFSLIGVAIAAGLARRSATPRRTWVRVTVALTALSLVPDLIVPAALETRALLILTHLVAAAIVIPALAARLPE